MARITSIGEILFDVYPDNKKMGGAPFNFIFHVIKLTGEGNFVSRIGNDELGNEILKFFSENNLDKKYIQIDDKHPTGTAEPTLSESKVPEWKIQTNTAYDFIEKRNELEHLVNEKTDCLYFGTLAQRGEETKKTIQSFFIKNIKYFCDLNIRQKFYSEEIIEESLKAADVLKINIDELKLINDLIIKNDFNPEKISLKIKEKYNIDMLCVTSGDEGASLFFKGRSDKFKLKVDNIVDTVGAGDAYAALLCIGYMNNWDLSMINKTASEFAGEIVKIKGAIPDDDNIYRNFREKINEK